MTFAVALIITIFAIMLSGLFSGAEIAFVQSNKVKIEIDASRGGVVNRILNSFNRHQDMFISTLLVGNNVVLVIYGITISLLINPVLIRIVDNNAFVLVANTIVSTGVILITGEFLPKTVFRINPNVMLKIFAFPLFVIYVILYPVSLFTFRLSRGLMRVFGIAKDDEDRGPLTIEQLDDYIQQSMDERYSENEEVEHEVKIFQKAIDFKDTRIMDCMIPRNEIIAVNIVGTTREQLLKNFMATGLSKIVVYRNDIDDVVGYIHVSELFDPSVDWTTRLKSVLFTPETMLANKMMRRLLSEKRSMAIVVDEFGGTAGIITLEDLVEEIFGEIEDEHDRKRLVAEEVSENVYRFSGRVEIERINDEFHLGLKESEDYHTIAGYIIDHLEALPLQGDVFEFDNLSFKILKMSATRIELVEVYAS